ncbi:MAG: hypothetical protein V4530_06170 [Pseudomonadota bacterium]
MSSPLAEVLVLPTRAVVDAAWSRHCDFCARLAANPRLKDDPDFAAAAAEAERAYVKAYERWNGR